MNAIKKVILIAMFAAVTSLTYALPTTSFSVNQEAKKIFIDNNPLNKIIQLAAIECPVGSGDYCSGITPTCCYGNDFYCASSCK